MRVVGRGGCPRTCNQWLRGVLVLAMLVLGGVGSAAFLVDHDYRLGEVLIAVRTLDSDRDPISSLIAPPGLYYHDLGRPDANHWTWRWGRRYCRFPR